HIPQKLYLWDKVPRLTSPTSRSLQRTTARCDVHLRYIPLYRAAGEGRAPDRKQERTVNRYILLPILAPLMSVPVAHAAGADSSSVNASNEIVIQTSRDKGDYRVDSLDSIG